MPLNVIDFAHNNYLQVVAELGIIGAVLAATLALLVASKVVVALRRRDSPNWAFAVGLAAALLAFGVHSLADFNLYIPANALVFAWLSGRWQAPA